MTNILTTRLAFVFVAAGLFCLPAAGQEKELGQKYAEMSDAQLWAEVMKCDGREQIQALLDQIPLSVMAKHGMAAMETPKDESSFGNMITQVIWTELSQDDEPGSYCERLVKSRIWKDASGKHKVEAQIFDVRPSHVILQKKDKKRVEVPTDRLSTTSRFQVRKYQQIRQEFAERIPADKTQLSNLIAKRMGGLLERVSRLKLMKTIDIAKSHPWSQGLYSYEASLTFDDTGNRLFMSSMAGVVLYDAWTGRNIPIGEKKHLSKISINTPHHEMGLLRKNLFTSHYLFETRTYRDTSEKSGTVLVDLVSKKIVHEIPGDIVFAAISENDTAAAWVVDNHAGGSPSIEIFDLKSGNIKAIRDRSGPFWLSADGTRLLTLTQPNPDTLNFQLWDTATTDLIRESEIKDKNAQMWPFSCPVSRDCSQTIMPGIDGLSLLDFETGEIRRLDADLKNLEFPFALEFSANSKQLFLVTKHEISQWNVAKPETKVRWKRHKSNDALELKISPDKTKMAILTIKDVSIWNPGSWHFDLLFPHIGYSGTRYGDGMEIWDLNAGELVADIPIAQGEIIYGFDFSPNNRYLAIMSITLDKDKEKISNRAIKIWRLPK